MAILSYRNVQIHGGSPIVVDPATGKLRFARLGKDRPEHCVSDPAQLPDCEMTLHAFASAREQRIWKATAAMNGADCEFLVDPGSGAIAPETRVIEMRLDRPRRPGAILDEVIPLSRPEVPEMSPRVERETLPVGDEWAELERQGGSSKSVRRWMEAHRSAVDPLRVAGFEVDLDQNRGNALAMGRQKLMFSRGRRTFWRQPDGSIEFEDRRLAKTRFPEDVRLGPGFQGRFRVAVRGFCRVHDASLTFLPEAGGTDDENVAAFVATLERIDRLHAALLREQTTATAGARLAADRRLLTLLDRAHAGCLPVSIGEGWSAQVVPRDGSVQSNPVMVGEPLKRALSHGLVEACADQGGAIAYGLTEVGRALAERDMRAVDAHFAIHPPTPDGPGKAAAPSAPVRRDPLAFSDPARFAKTRHGIALALAAIEGRRAADPGRVGWQPLLRTASHLGMAVYDDALGVVLTEPDAVPRPAP